MAQRSIESLIRRLIQRKQLARIEIVTRDGVNFTAIAYPAPWHPIIAERRRAGFVRATEAVGRSLTIAEAQAVEDKAREDSLARANGKSIEQAVSLLAHIF